MKQEYSQSGDTFTRIFYPTSKGSALCLASPSLSLDPITGKVYGDNFWERGMLIGDVVLRAPMGDVIYVFNVLLPADDPRNMRGTRRLTPPDFVPLVLDPENDLVVAKDCFPRHSIVGGTNDIEKPFVLHKLNGGNKLKVTSGASEGALFALPLGGSTYECTASGRKKLRDFALAHGRSWHEHASATLGCHWTNGYMCLVTGCDKTRFWASCFYENLDSGQCDFSIDVDMSMSKDSLIFERNSEYSGYAPTYQMGPTASKDASAERNCLAFRAFHISLQPYLFLALPSIKTMSKACPDHKPSNPYFFKFMHSAIRPPVESFEEYWAAFDPLLKINQLIHRSAPRVVIAVVHDDDLVDVLDPKDNRLPSIRELKRRMTINSSIAVTADSNAYLIRRDDHDRGIVGHWFGALRGPLAALGVFSFRTVDA